MTTEKNTSFSKIAGNSESNFPDSLEKTTLKKRLKNRIINTSYWYTDEDVSLCTRACTQSLGNVSGYRYILKSPKQEQIKPTKDGKQYWVILTPPVGSSNRTLTLDYYLNRNKQPEHRLIPLLTPFLDEVVLTGLKKKEAKGESIAWIGLCLIDETDDEDTLKLVHKILKESRYKLGALKVKKDILAKEDKRRDVFDEAMPLLKKKESAHAKILCPYRRSGNHWVTIEIILLQTKQRYDVEVFLHDPKGGGVCTEDEKIILKVAIEAGIKRYTPNIHESHLKVRHSVSHYAARQGEEDSSSCGPIMVADLMKCMRGHIWTRCICKK